MRPRLLALASFVLYLIATASPALREVNPSPEVNVRPIYGADCIVYGVIYFYVIFPLICWIPNPLIWTLWYRAGTNQYSSRWSWSAPVFAMAVLFYLGGMYQVMPGAYFWVASAAVGAFAARQTDDSRWRE